MAKRNCWSVSGCNSDHRYPEKDVFKDHTGFPGDFFGGKAHISRPLPNEILK